MIAFKVRLGLGNRVEISNEFTISQNQFQRPTISCGLQTWVRGIPKFVWGAHKQTWYEQKLPPSCTQVSRAGWHKPKIRWEAYCTTPCERLSSNDSKNNNRCRKFGSVVNILTKPKSRLQKLYGFLQNMYGILQFFRFSDNCVYNLLTVGVKQIMAFIIW